MTFSSPAPTPLSQSMYCFWNKEVCGRASCSTCPFANARHGAGGREKVARVMGEEGRMSLHYTVVFKVKIRTVHLMRGKGGSIKKKHFDKDQ